MKKLNQPKGFSLTEILIYVTIIGIMGTFLGGVVINALKIQSRQSVSSEVSQQIDFVLENIQRYTRNASLIDISTTTPTSSLTLRMQNSVQDPTLIYLSGGKVFLKEGAGTAIVLTSDKVNVDRLDFSKVATAGGHDTVQVDLMVSYNSSNPLQRFSKSLTSSIARVSAATFDSSLIPGADNSYDVGISTPRWRNGYFSGNVLVGGNLGIGTTGPSTKLEVTDGDIRSGIEITAGYPFLKLMNTNANANARNWALSHSIIEQGDFAILQSNAKDGDPVTAATSRLYFGRTGNVGIGTTGPSQKLEVSGGTIKADNGIWTTTNGFAVGGNAPLGWQTASFRTGNDWRIVDSGHLNFNLGGGSSILHLNQNGNVGIGTTGPTSKLQVVGLSEYADNAAAVTAGLTVGAFYRTGDLLKVVH